MNIHVWEVVQQSNFHLFVLFAAVSVEVAPQTDISTFDPLCMLTSSFQISDDKKLKKTDEEDLHDKFFADASKAKKYVDLVHFEPFADTADAVTAAAACIDGKVSKSLKSFLKKQLKKSGNGDSLAIADKNLVAGIKDAVPNLPCTLACDSKTNELFRGIRCYLDELMEGGSSEDDGPALSDADLNAMRLGLSHSLSRYKLKFSADKVDTMVIQAIGLLDELDKEINTYAMRVKEWYGWHFPGKCYAMLY